MPRFSTNETDRQIGRRIRQRRKDLSLSQAALADALGMSFQQIQKYETGTNQIAASLLLEVSSHLCVPVIYFYSDAQIQSAPFENTLAYDGRVTGQMTFQYGGFAKSR